MGGFLTPSGRPMNQGGGDPVSWLVIFLLAVAAAGIAIGAWLT